MPARIDARPILVLIGSVLLLISLSLDWYVTPGTPPNADIPIGNAWGVFETLDIVLAAIAAAALYVAYEQLTGRDRFAAWLLPLSALALLIVGSQIIDPPPNVESAIVPAGTVTPDPTTGAWLALAGTAGLFVAGVLSRASISLALTTDAPSSMRSRPSPGPSREFSTEA